MTASAQPSPGDIQLEKYRQLVTMLPQSIRFGAALSAMVVIFLWRTQQPLLLAAWFAAHLLLSWWRFRAINQFTSMHESDSVAAMKLAPRIQLGCLLSAVVWGATAMVPYPPESLQAPLFVAFILAGVTAGAAMAMTADFVSAIGFQVIVFAFLLVRLWIIEAGTVYHAMATTALLYGVFLTLWTSRIHGNALDGIRAQLIARQREQLLQEREARYRELAHHDALTGLPNRLSLQARMPDILESAAAANRKIAVIYIDLDHFKDINDSRGHRCGDTLLAAAAESLNRCVRPADVVVRMGGDEFIVVTSDAREPGQVASLAARLAEGISKPVAYEGELIVCTASMGIALFPDHGTDADQLLKNADIALYQAKAAGRNNHQLFAPAMSVAFGERIFLEHALDRALGTGQLYLEYQPLVDLGSGNLIAVEALLRWNHPERGLVPPLTFIPIAEHCGLIDALGSEVLTLVCRQIQEWQQSGIPVLPVAVNVSPRQFERGGLEVLLQNVTRSHQVAPALLQIEITETALMKGTGHQNLTLQKLRGLGVKVLIDDFGIGYSSLNHLKSLAIDGLKVDRSFVRDMIDDPRDAAIVAAIIDIAKNLGIAVIAEGVESQRHMQQLRQLGCETGQGNYLYEPVSGQRCGELLSAPAPQRRRQERLAAQ